MSTVRHKDHSARCRATRYTYLSEVSGIEVIMEGFTFTPQLGLIVGGIVGMIIGWAIGFFDSNRNSSKKIKQAEELSQIAVQQAKDTIAQVEAQLAAVNATPVTVDDPGLLRIKNENGALTLDLDGSRVNPIALYPEQRKRL